MQSSFNRGFHIPGVFEVRMSSARLRQGVVALFDGVVA
jgi:hypothetical protein